MKRSWFMIVFAMMVIVPPIIHGISGAVKRERFLFTHTVDQTGDTAHVLKLNVLSGLDSFVYIDSVWFEGDSTIVKWVSPLQVRRITPEVDTSGTYTCSLDCGTNVYGFEWDASGLTQNALANLIDTLVDSINNVAGISDTVVAQDSVTYIKLVSKFKQAGLESDARWTLILADELAGKETDSTKTTVAMLCDSLAAAFNDSSTISDTLTAANSGDTIVTITGDRKGWTINLFVGDTAQTMAEVVAEKATWTYDSQYFALFPMGSEGFTSIWGTVVMRAPAYDGKGWGLADSVRIRLYRWSALRGYEMVGTDSVVAEASGDTLYVTHLGTDTLYGEMLYLQVMSMDSATDTAVAVDYWIDYEFIVH